MLFFYITFFFSLFILLNQDTTWDRKCLWERLTDLTCLSIYADKFHQNLHIVKNSLIVLRLTAFESA